MAMTLKLRPVEEAIERALRRTDPNAPNARELDAAGVARVLLKHWGDEAPLVLGRALELARDTVGSWTPKAPPAGLVPAGGPPPPVENTPPAAGTDPRSSDREGGAGGGATEDPGPLFRVRGGAP